MDARTPELVLSDNDDDDDADDVDDDVGAIGRDNTDYDKFKSGLAALVPISNFEGLKKAHDFINEPGNDALFVKYLNKRCKLKDGSGPSLQIFLSNMMHRTIIDSYTWCGPNMKRTERAEYQSRVLLEMPEANHKGELRAFPMIRTACDVIRKKFRSSKSLDDFKKIEKKN